MLVRKISYHPVKSHQNQFSSVKVSLTDYIGILVIMYVLVFDIIELILD